MWYYAVLFKAYTAIGDLLKLLLLICPIPNKLSSPVNLALSLCTDRVVITGRLMACPFSDFESTSKNTYES